LRVCAACPTSRLNQSYELRPPWEQHLRYVPHRVRNRYNRRQSGKEEGNSESDTDAICRVREFVWHIKLYKSDH